MALGRVIATYQMSGKPALLEPAREAVEALLARMDDETEDGALRLAVMNQWSVIQPPPAGRAPEGGAIGDRSRGYQGSTSFPCCLDRGARQGGQEQKRWRSFQGDGDSWG